MASKDPPEFVLDGRKYSYIRTHRTKVNERCVELPLGHDFLRDAKKPVEIGNVMRTHQRNRRHLVVDLHEKRSGWSNYLNQDLLTWSPPEDTSHVLSISTVEHCQDPARGIRRLLSWAPRVLITFPLGYACQGLYSSTELALMDFGVSRSFLARSPVVSTGLQHWQQVPEEAIRGMAQDRLAWGQHPQPYHLSAAAIVVLRK